LCAVARLIERRKRFANARAVLLRAINKVKRKTMMMVRLVSILALTLAATFADSHGAMAAPVFQTAPCPKTPEPTSSLQHSRCGYLIVPENRSKPQSRTIRLAVAIVPSRTKPAKPDPIVFMAGGPGEAAILDIPFLVDAGINSDRDIIIMNQRGTLYDTPDLNCPELEKYYAEQVSLVYDAPSTGRAQTAAAKACHDRLVGMGVDLSAYNTTENEADFVDLRRALNVPQWNVYGYSYGTDLALSLVRDHPDGIRTVTIDSVVPPNIVSLPWTWNSTREGITTIFNDCAAQPSCAKKYPNLLATLTRMVQRLEAHPLVRNVVPPGGKQPVKVILDGGMLVNMLVGNRPKAAEVPRAITELANGNPRIFLETRAAAAHVSEVPDQALGMTHSFVCGEWEPYGGPDDILRAGKKEFPTWPDSVLLQAPQLPFQRELCQVWNVPARPASQRVPVRTAIPTLVVSGAIDSKTGARWGRYVADALSNSTYVRIRGIAHWVIVQSPCAQQIFRSFLQAPRSPSTACAATAPGVDFK
jgi:pimeloyl-ACP methyl ester carboxylesterase